MSQLFTQNATNLKVVRSFQSYTSETQIKDTAAERAAYSVFMCHDVLGDEMVFDGFDDLLATKLSHDGLDDLLATFWRRFGDVLATFWRRNSIPLPKGRQNRQNHFVA